jgi:hypothetical protein
MQICKFSGFISSLKAFSVVGGRISNLLEVVRAGWISVSFVRQSDNVTVHSLCL